MSPIITTDAPGTAPAAAAGAATSESPPHSISQPINKLISRSNSVLKLCSAAFVWGPWLVLINSWWSSRNRSLWCSRNWRLLFKGPFRIHRDQEDNFFAWPSAALLCIKTRSAIATEYFPLPPLQQVEVSIRSSRSFNRKLRRSILELTEIKSINHAMRTTLHAKEFLRRVSRDSCRPAYQINSTIHRPLH